MQKMRIKIIFAALALALLPAIGHAQINDEARPLPNDDYMVGTVTRVFGATDRDRPTGSAIVQKVRIKITRGIEQGQEITADNNVPSNDPAGFSLAVGDRVVVAKNYAVDGDFYCVTDLARTRQLWVIGAFFVILAVMLGRKRGVTSLVGLAISIAVIFLFIIPRILAGNNPAVISAIGGAMILFPSLYLAHGFRIRTTIALIGTMITLGIAIILDVIFVRYTNLLGTSEEAAFFLSLTPDTPIDVVSVLIGGIIIGTLGVLDDITTSQAAIVHELHDANPALSSYELYRRALSVGREHIASLINTLALAYVGAALPVLLLFSVNKIQPLWVIMNNQDIAEEIVRTVVGSSTLILAVPITTALAAAYFGKRVKQ